MTYDSYSAADKADFLSYTEQLKVLAERLMTSQIMINHPTKCPVDYMVVAYATRQIEQIKTVSVLAVAGQDRDSLLIARSMIEGLAQLLWAYNDRPARPELWWNFGYIMDWRTVKENEANGIFSSPDDQKNLDEGMAQYADAYITGRARKKIHEGMSPADPYRREWHDVSVADMFTQLKARRLYDTFYRSTSDWAHWNVRELIRATSSDEPGKMLYFEEDTFSASTSLLSAYQALSQTIEVVLAHFASHFTDQDRADCLTLNQEFRNRFFSTT